MPLTTTYQLKTFRDLYTAVLEELKIQSSDTTAINRIKRDINIVYLEEVVPFAQWKWLRGTFDATVYAAISAGTAAATQGSTTVTLTIPIASPKTGWLFGIVGYNEVYRIANHTAGSATVTLEAPYTGATVPTGSYKIWTDEIFLPSFVRETFSITHDFQDQALENCGLQKYRQYVAALPRAEGRPNFYTTNTYVDPVAYAVPTGMPAISTRASSAITKTLVFASDVSNYIQQGDRIRITGCTDSSYNGEFVISTQVTTTITYTAMVGTYEATVSDSTITLQKMQPSSDTRRAKRVQVYPAIFQANTTLHIDYIREVVGLADDTDEPLMPIGDRSILLNGALNRAWSRERNPEEAKRNFDLFALKLARMAGKMDDSIDQPRLSPNKIYLGSKRMAQRQNSTRSGLPEGWGGGSGSGNVATGIANRVSIFGSDGVLTASSVTSAQLAAFASASSGTPSTVAVFDSSGVFGSSTVTTTQLAGLAAGISDRLAYYNGSLILSASSVTNTQVANVVALGLGSSQSANTFLGASSAASSVPSFRALAPKDIPWYQFNVRNYGAKGDGVTDDKAAIQSAINAAQLIGGEVYIPYSAGGYPISNGLQVSNQCSITGDQPSFTSALSCSTLFYTGSSGAPMITATSGANNFTIRNLTLNNSSSATMALQLNGVHATVDNITSNSLVKFKGGAVISTYQSASYNYNTIIRNCNFQVPLLGQETLIGVRFGGGHTQIVDRCFFSGFVTGIKYEAAGGSGGGALGCSVTNSHIESFAGVNNGYPGASSAVGIYCDGPAYGVNITGCNFQMNGEQISAGAAQRAITLYNVQGANICGNQFLGGSGAAAVSMPTSSASGVFLSGNNFYSYGLMAVEVLSSSASYRVGINDYTLTSSAFSNNIYNSRFTPNSVVVTNSLSDLTTSTVSTTTLGYLDATSSIQNQLNARGSSANPSFSGVISTNMVPSRAIATDSSSAFVSSSASLTQLNYLSAATGTTGSGNLPFSISPTFTGTMTASTGAFSGPLTVSHSSSASLFVSGTALNVGMGTTSPNLGSFGAKWSILTLRGLGAAGEAASALELGANTASANSGDYCAQNRAYNGSNCVTNTLSLVAANSNALSGQYRFQTASSAGTLINGVQIDHTQNVLTGPQLLVTNATDGFLYIPTSSGTPVGTPTSQTNLNPICFDKVNNRFYAYNSTAWKIGIPQVGTLTLSSSAVAWDMNTSPNAIIMNPASNFTLSNPTNILAGNSGILTVTQDSTGSRLITYGTAYKFSGGTAFTLSTSAGNVDNLSWYSPDGVSVHFVGQAAFR